MHRFGRINCQYRMRISIVYLNLTIPAKVLNNEKNIVLTRPWISPWIKLISNELDITCPVLASQLSGHCGVIANRLWRHQQLVERARETRGWWVKIHVLASCMDLLCRVRNKIMYVLLWRTAYALTWVLFWCLFPSLLRNSGYKHQNNPLVSASTVRHASTYVILCLCNSKLTLL